MTPSACQTGLTGVQRVQEQDKEGAAAESATVKRKVSAAAARLVGTEGTCNACKKVGVAAECMYRTGVACAQCKLAKLCCSLVQGRHRQRKPTEAAGSLAVVAVVIEMRKSKSPLSVFPALTHRLNRWKDGLAVGQGRPQQKGSLAHRG